MQERRRKKKRQVEHTTEKLMCCLYKLRSQCLECCQDRIATLALNQKHPFSNPNLQNSIITSSTGGIVLVRKRQVFNQKDDSKL